MTKTAQDSINEKLLLADRKMYDKCMARLAPSVERGLTLDFQYIKFDSNNNRKEQDLVEMLVSHIVAYSLDEQDIKRAQSPVSPAFHRAMSLFAQRGDSGESGEVLLYILIELFLGAPQILAKMSLKTSPHLEYNGADGVHMKYNGPSQPLDIYLGESKIWDSPAAAIDDALDSIAKIREHGIKHEITLASKHFKWIDPAVRDVVLNLLDDESAGQDYRIGFAVLVGFGQGPHKSRTTKETLQDFVARYERKTTRLKDLLFEKIDERKKSGEVHDDIIHVFFVPLSDVAKFRAMFLSYLTTGRFGK